MSYDLELQENDDETGPRLRSSVIGVPDNDMNGTQKHMACIVERIAPPILKPTHATRARQDEVEREGRYVYTSTIT